MNSLNRQSKQTNKSNKQTSQTNTYKKIKTTYSSKEQAKFGEKCWKKFRRMIQEEGEMFQKDH